MALALGSGVERDVLEPAVSPHPPPAIAAGERDVSVQPNMTIVGATPAQKGRFELAVLRFLSAGLDLPDMKIAFHDSLESCGGAKGTFWSLPKGISFCSDEIDVVYEHELAHAWAAASLTDSQRSHFMQRNGLATWSDRDVPWNDRATERVAVIIQQGVSGLPLPPSMNEEVLRSVREFERLTGSPDPRMIEWSWQYSAARPVTAT